MALNSGEHKEAGFVVDEQGRRIVVPSVDALPAGAHKEAGGIVDADGRQVVSMADTSGLPFVPSSQVAFDALSVLAGTMEGAAANEATYGFRFTRDSGSGLGQFVREIGGQYFSPAGAPQGQSSAGGAVWDPVLYVGYNYGNRAQPILAGESGAAYVIEGNYQDGAGLRMEQYQEHFTKGIPAGTWLGGIRPSFVQTTKTATTPETFLGLNILSGNPFQIGVPDDAVGGQSPLRTVVNVTKTNIVSIGGTDTEGGAKTGYNTILRLWSASGATSQLALSYSGTQDSMKLYPVSATEVELDVGSSSPSKLIMDTTGSVRLVGANGSTSTLYLRFQGGGKNDIAIGGAGDATSPASMAFGPSAAAQPEIYMLKQTVAGQPRIGIGTYTTTTNSITLGDGLNLIFNTTTGTKIGTGATQKLAFYGAAPLAQQTGVAVTAAGIHAALVALGLITA